MNVTHQFHQHKCNVRCCQTAAVNTFFYLCVFGLPDTFYSAVSVFPVGPEKQQVSRPSIFSTYYEILFSCVGKQKLASLPVFFFFNSQIYISADKILILFFFFSNPVGFQVWSFLGPLSRTKTHTREGSLGHLGPIKHKENPNMKGCTAGKPHFETQHSA